jgi:hypothetical protein
MKVTLTKKKSEELFYNSLCNKLDYISGYRFQIMKITLTKKESEELFYNSLCNGLDYISGHGIELDYSNSDYEKAKSNWKTYCHEDVLMQILRDGNTLKIIDHECDGEYNEFITLENVHSRVQNTPTDHLMDAINENDDAETADVILQTVIYEDIIFC